MTKPLLNSLSRGATAGRMLLIGAMSALLHTTAAAAEETPGAGMPVTKGPAKVRIVGPDGTEKSVEPAVNSDVQRYCANIADPALDARNALQMVKLGEAEVQVSAKIDELETKRQEVQVWLADRKAFMDSTSDIMIDIYAGMKPDAAASQLAGLKRPVAAALLARLKSRQASAILSEMPAAVASEIANLIVDKTDRAASAGPLEAEQRL